MSRARRAHCASLAGSAASVMLVAMYFGQVVDSGGRCRGAGQHALDVDLIDKAGANLPRSQPNRLDRQALDLAHGRR